MFLFIILKNNLKNSLNIALDIFSPFIYSTSNFIFCFWHISHRKNVNTSQCTVQKNHGYLTVHQTQK